MLIITNSVLHIMSVTGPCHAFGMACFAGSTVAASLWMKLFHLLSPSSLGLMMLGPDVSLVHLAPGND